MLSKKQVTFAHSLYYSLTKCGFYPFILDLKSGKISRQRSKSRWNLWLFFLLLTACRASLGTVRIVSAFVSARKTPAEDLPLMINQAVYWLAVYIYPCVFHKYMDVTISVFNSLLENPVRRSTWRTVTVQELVVLFVLPPNVFFVPALYAGMLAIRPMAPYNLFSALQPTWQSTPVLVAIILVDSFVIFYIWALAVFITHILLLFFQKCIEETTHTLQTVATIKTNWQRAVKMEEAMQDMRKLQLLIRIYNVGYKDIHALMKIVALFWFIIFTSFGILISRSNPFMSFAYLFFGIQISIVYCVTFHKAFAIPMLTRKVKMKLSNLAKSSSIHGQTNGNFAAWTRSIPPIGIRVGNFHLFERMSTPNFLAFGIKNITRILIAHRSQ